MVEWTDEMIGASVGLNFSKPVYHDVKGAPFKIGERVRVVLLCDETGNQRFLGKVGVVKFLEYSCGCGQTYPYDPMIGVDFGRKIHGKQFEEFWKDELMVVKNPLPRPLHWMADYLMNDRNGKTFNCPKYLKDRLPFIF